MTTWNVISRTITRPETDAKIKDISVEKQTISGDDASRLDSRCQSLTDLQRRALHQFERNSRDENPRNAYNFAVARIIATIRDEKLNPSTQPLRVPANGGDFCARGSTCTSPRKLAVPLTQTISGRPG